jgi:hypothetical protein
MKQDGSVTCLLTEKIMATGKISNERYIAVLEISNLGTHYPTLFCELHAHISIDL